MKKRKNNILYSFDPELWLKDTEPEIKNKLMDSLPKLQGCEFVATLALEFIKLKNDNKTIYCTSYLNSKQKKLLMKV